MWLGILNPAILWQESAPTQQTVRRTPSSQRTQLPVFAVATTIDTRNAICICGSRNNRAVATPRPPCPRQGFRGPPFGGTIRRRNRSTSPNCHATRGLALCCGRGGGLTLPEILHIYIVLVCVGSGLGVGGAAVWAWVQSWVHASSQLCKGREVDVGVGKRSEAQCGALQRPRLGAPGQISRSRADLAHWQGRCAKCPAPPPQNVPVAPFLVQLRAL